MSKKNAIELIPTETPDIKEQILQLSKCEEKEAFKASVTITVDEYRELVKNSEKINMVKAFLNASEYFPRTELEALINA